MAKKKSEEDIVEETEFKFEESNEDIEERAVYSLGFRNLNTIIGFIECDEETGEIIQTIRGMLSGSLVSYIGRSGTGKTTLACQNMCQAVRPFVREKNDKVKIHIVSNEKGITRSRFKTISNFVNEEMKRHVIFHAESSIEFLNKLTKSIIDEKKNMKKIKAKSYTGKDIEMYPPTFLFIDAWSELLPENLSEEEKADQKMMYFTQARLLDQYIKKFKNLFAPYNINVFAIAHMSKRHNLDNPMVRLSREFKAIPADEKINGGKNFLYHTDIGVFIYKIVADSPETMEKKSLKYLDGQNIMLAKLWKSRQSRDNVSFRLVSDENGFNPLKSFVYECADLKILESSGPYKKIRGTDIKVKSSQLMQTFVSDESFRNKLFEEFDKEYDYIFKAGRIGAKERKQNLEILDMLDS